MNKKLIYKYQDFKNLRSIGANWIDEVRSYFPIGDWIQKASLWQVAAWAAHLTWVQYWMLLILFAGKFYFSIFYNWYAGKIILKKNINQTTLQYDSKAKHINPVASEQLRTIANIAEKVGAKNEITIL